MTTKAEDLDDKSISDSTKLLRRIPTGRFSRLDGRPDSSSFKKDPEGIGTSVTMWLSSSDLDAIRRPKPEFGIAGITAGEARDSGFWIQRTFEEDNPNHCEMGGAVSNGKREKLSKRVRWVCLPVDFPNELKGVLWTIDSDQ